MKEGQTQDVLGESWFPVGEVSVESMRERIPGIDYPPPNKIHVWFARRPLITSRAAILGSLLASDIQKDRFFKFLSIPINRDIVAIHQEFVRLKAEKKNVRNPCDWPQAYKVKILDETIGYLNEHISKNSVILDPFAGGGSIPLEAVRLGLNVAANDLNPVAYFCLKGTVEYPARFGIRLEGAVREFSEQVRVRAALDLERYYPKGEDEEVFAYLWARTIRCPHCGLTIPLSPNWWVARTDDKKVAVRVIAPKKGKGNECSFEIIENPKAKDYDPDKGTTTSSNAVCPRCLSTVEGKYIKEEAQAGRMGHQLYCVCTKIPKLRGRGKLWKFRLPTEVEHAASEEALRVVEEHRDEWIAEDLVPSEEIVLGNKTREPLNYGMNRWIHFFNPRQLLAHATYTQAFRAEKEILFAGKEAGTEEYEFATAVATYGAMIFDTCLNYDSVQSRWDATRSSIRSAMDVQAFPFRWSYAEFDHSKMLWPWAQEKTLDSLRDIVAFMPETPGTITPIMGQAQALPCAAKSVSAIVTDPPYSNNVMYAEVSDFFYVWLKRLIGDIFPAQFSIEQTNKADEAVANTARFNGIKKGKAKLLAEQDYAAKMEAAFREMHRMLKDDGVLCVMFTHREAKAWAGLAESLMNAGFTLKSSWPVHTEPGEKFGKTNKGALKVTILLYCRKRGEHRPGRWEDVVDEVREAARSKVEEYCRLGIKGPDLLVSVYGPALGCFSQYYPVKDVHGKIRGAEEALMIVAQVVNEYLTGDIQGADMESLAYLNLLRCAPTLTIEYDLARITTVFGGNTSVDSMDVKNGSGLVEKKGGKVNILTSKNRFAAGILDPDAPTSFCNLMDAVHAALILYERDGLEAVTRILQEAGRDTADSGVISVLQAITLAGEDGSSDLKGEARVASALLEALGHTSGGHGKTGERITHWV